MDYICYISFLIMLKKFICLFLVILLIASCRKKEEEATKFNVSLSQQNRTITLNWNSVNLSSFKNVSIYRSTSPIPEPNFSNPIDQSLLIATISDKTLTSFADSNELLSTDGKVYYRLVLNLTNRFIVSNQVEASFNAFSLTVFNSQFGNNMITAELPQADLLYVVDYNGGHIYLVDYSQRKVLASANISAANYEVSARMEGNLPRLYLYGANTFMCYDGLNLNLKYSIPLGSNTTDYKLRGNYLYVLSTYPTIQTYDITSQSMIDEFHFYYPNSSGPVYNSGLLTSSSGNIIYVKNNMSVYNSQSGSYVYKNYLLKMNLSNNHPVDTSMVNIAALSADSMNSGTAGLNYINMSNDGKYLVCNRYGDVYSFSDQITHKLQSSINPSPNVSFSADGNYMMVRSVTFSGLTNIPMEIYALSSFSKIATQPSLNPSVINNLSVGNDFLDNDTLVSYNIKLINNNGVLAGVLSMAFKKIN